MRRLVLLIITLAITAACNGNSYSGSNAPSATPIPAGANTVLVPSGSYNGPGPGHHRTHVDR
jgi:hypothetical protein